MQGFFRHAFEIVEMQLDDNGIGIALLELLPLQREAADARKQRFLSLIDFAEQKPAARSPGIRAPVQGVGEILFLALAIAEQLEAWGVGYFVSAGERGQQLQQLSAQSLLLLVFEAAPDVVRVGGLDEGKLCR